MEASGSSLQAAPDGSACPTFRSSETATGRHPRLLTQPKTNNGGDMPTIPTPETDKELILLRDVDRIRREWILLRLRLLLLAQDDQTPSRIKELLIGWIQDSEI